MQNMILTSWRRARNSAYSIQRFFKIKNRTNYATKIRPTAKKYMYLPCDVSGRGVLLTNQRRSRI